MEPTIEQSNRIDDYLAGSGPVVLLVEDDNVNMFLVYKQVRRAYPTYNVLVAYNGKEGILKYLSYSPDIILTDIKMPELNGHEMTMQIRDIERGLGRRIPIVAITSNTMTSKKCLGCGPRCVGSAGCGIDAFFTKPVNLADITTIMSFIHTIPHEHHTT